MGEGDLSSILTTDAQWMWYAGVLRDFESRYAKDHYDAWTESFNESDDDKVATTKKEIFQSHLGALIFCKRNPAIVQALVDKYNRAQEALGQGAELPEPSQASTARAPTHTWKSGSRISASSRATEASHRFASIAEVLSRNDNTDGSTEPDSDMSADPGSTRTGTA
jgi:hypothetical protein